MAVKPSNFKFDFTVITSDRVFVLYAETQEEKKKWLRALMSLKKEMDKVDMVKSLEAKGQVETGTTEELFKDRMQVLMRIRSSSLCGVRHNMAKEAEL